MSNPSVNPLSNYDARTFTLLANMPVALPPARDYVILSATVNADLVGLTVSDSNGDAGLWPIGIKVRLTKRMPARLSSTVAQSVTVLMVDGDVEVEDNRVLTPLSMSGFTTPIISLGALAPGSYVIVGGAANTRGIILTNADLSLQSTVANGGYMSLYSGFVLLGSVFAPAGVLQNNSKAIVGNFLIPAGSALSVDVVLAVALQGGYSMSYRAL